MARAETNLATIETNMATVDTNMATAEKNLATTETNMATAEKTMATVETTMATAATNMATTETNMSTAETNMATVETNMATAATNMATTETNMATAETAMATAATNMATTETNMATAETNMATVETNMATAEINMATLKTNMATARTNMATAETNMATVETNMATAETNMATVETNMATVEKNMATAGTNMGTVETNMATVKTSMATVETNMATVETNMATVETNMATAGTTDATSMHSELTEEEEDWERLLNLKIFREAVCLISTSRNLVLKIEEDAVRELESIDKEMNVVAITGLYRTGKSVLLNQLSRKKGGNPAFGVGHATTAMTRGIWAFCVRHPVFRDQVLMLLDTEGLGDIKKGDADHDNKLFTIATLLSSTLLYNITGAFNHDALEKLTFITRISDNILLSDDTDNQYQVKEKAFPTFVLCLRDFFLNLPEKGAHGDTITPDEYLEECLRKEQGHGKQSREKYNQLRKAIKRFFVQRHCFTFPSPTTKQEDLKTFDSATPEPFTEEFKADLEKFMAFIYKCPPKLMLNGDKTTGKALSSMARTYVQCISEGSTPGVGEAMMYVADKRNQKQISDGIQSFVTNIRTIQLPETNLQVLEDHCQRYLNQEVAIFKEEIIFDDKDRCLSELKTKLKEEWDKVASSNREMLFQNGIEELEKLHNPISKDVDRGIYAHSGGHVAYRKAIQGRDDSFMKLTDLYGNQALQTLTIVNSVVQAQTALKVQWSLMVEVFNNRKQGENQKVQADAKDARKKTALEEQVQCLVKSNEELKEAKIALDKELEKSRKEANDQVRGLTERTEQAQRLREADVALRTEKSNNGLLKQRLKLAEEKLDWITKQAERDKCTII